jgi:hypothetical protein
MKRAVITTLIVMAVTVVVVLVALDVLFPR